MREARSLLCILHWRVVPFIEVLLETVQSGLVASSRDSEEHAYGCSCILMRSWYDDTPTSPFVNKQKHCAFKRPSYTSIPVLISCIILKGPLNCYLRAVSQLSNISSHFRTEFGFLQFVCVFLPLFLLKGPSFMV